MRKIKCRDKLGRCPEEVDHEEWVLAAVEKRQKRLFPEFLPGVDAVSSRLGGRE